MARHLRLSSLWLAVRSLTWACLLPGVVAGYVPWRFFGLSDAHVAWDSPLHLLGLALIAIGAALLASCVWEFAHRGRGTPAPLDPPTELVVQGLYRYVRNPMYVAVATIVLGELGLTRSSALLVYAAAGVVIAHLFVVVVEEPALRRQFGESYERYAASVNRWIPKLPGSAPA